MSLWPRFLAHPLSLCVCVLQYTNSLWPTLYLCVFVYCSRVGQTLHRKYLQYTNSSWPTLYLCVFVYCSRVGQTLHRKYLQYTNSLWPTLYLCVFVYCSRVGQTLHRKYLQYTNSLRDSTPIWLDGVQCTGSEDSLTECRHRDWGDSDCDHMDDVSIACYDNTTFAPHCERLRSF